MGLKQWWRIANTFMLILIIMGRVIMSWEDGPTISLCICLFEIRCNFVFDCCVVHFVILYPKFMKTCKSLPEYVFVNPVKNKSISTEIDWTMLFLALGSRKQKVGLSILLLPFMIVFKISPILNSYNCESLFPSRYACLNILSQISL